MKLFRNRVNIITLICTCIRRHRLDFRSYQKWSFFSFILSVLKKRRYTCKPAHYALSINTKINDDTTLKHLYRISLLKSEINCCTCGEKNIQSPSHFFTFLMLEMKVRVSKGEPSEHAHTSLHNISIDTPIHWFLLK